MMPDNGQPPVKWDRTEQDWKHKALALIIYLFLFFSDADADLFQVFIVCFFVSYFVSCFFKSSLRKSKACWIVLDFRNVMSFIAAPLTALTLVCKNTECTQVTRT